MAAAVLIGAATLSGCAWVKPTTAGAQVREASATDVFSCERIGTVDATTRATALGLPRDKEVVRDEQVTLARNRAGVMGGDTIVADGPESGGTLPFVVYRCH
jgi:hypothetical protein